jgi:1-acyl-sn-glycerol-3-phosphate acyltransferase
MIRTVLFAVVAGLMILISLVTVLLPYYLLRLLGLRKTAHGWLERAASAHGRALVTWTGSKVEVRGIERFPRDAERVCIVANHQSLFDIPLLEGFLPGMIGFVAKKELSRMGVLNLWMIELGSVLINRRNRRSAIEAISKGVERIRQGIPMAVFPEGTRSRSGAMGRFKPGSLKLALRAQAVVVPVTIDGTHHIFEGAGGIHPARITLTVHDPVHAEDMPEEEQKRLAEVLEETVKSALDSHSVDRMERAE